MIHGFSGWMVRQWAAAVAVVVVAAIVIMSCSGQKPSDASRQAAADVVVWHWMTDRDATLQELAQRYKEQTGTVVAFHLFAPAEAYGNRVRAAAVTKTLPDMYGILAETRDFASFIKSGMVEELTPYMQANNGAWQNGFFEKAMNMDTFPAGNQFAVPPGIYGAPIDVMNIQFFYNKDLFRQAGLDPESPPQTFAELLAVGKKLKAANIQGLVSGWGEIWMLNCLADNFAWNIMGADKVLATIKGEVPYTDADWVTVFDCFKQMNDSGLLASGIVTMVNKTAEQTFANQRAAIAFNGSWGVNVYKSMNPTLNYGIFLPPRISDAHPVRIWGGAGSSFKVNAGSARKAEAVAFLQWLTAVEQQTVLAQKTLNLPANKDSAGELPDMLQNIAATMDYAVHPSQFPVVEFPRVGEAMGKGLQMIIIGQQSPQQLAQELQTLKQQELKRRAASGK